MKKGLIIWGGWNEHNPEILSINIKNILENNNYSITSTSHFGSILDSDMSEYDVIIPIWSCGIISTPYMDAILKCVRNGSGFATFHGGINWFNHEEYYTMLGGKYLKDDIDNEMTVDFISSVKHFNNNFEPFSINDDFYHLDINPSCTIIATAKIKNNQYPIAWVKDYGKGKIFYTTLAHKIDNIFKTNVVNFIINGIKWVTRD